MAGPTFHYRWQWSLRSNVESLWAYVADTDRFRSATGFPPVTYTEEPLSEGGVHRIAHIRMYGLPIVWEEEPFEWILHREFTDIQKYSKGPLGYAKIHVELEPRSDGGTNIIYEVWVSPGNLLGYPGIPLQIGLLSRYRFGKAFEQIDRYVQENAPQAFSTRHTPVNSVGRARLRELTNQLTSAGYDSALVSRLIEHIRTAQDHELSRMRPYAMADMWHTDRNATLEMFLQATKLGLLDLSWDMLCPECRGAKHTAHHLHDVTHDLFCPSCNIAYEVDFARSVEATFQVNPAIKAVMREDFCLGSPNNTPHILLQQVLAPGETRTIKLLLAPHRYRWRVPKLGARNNSPRTINTLDDAIHGRAMLEANTHTKATTNTITIDDDELYSEPEEIGAGVVTLTVINHSSTSQIILLEQTDWSDQATTAAEVTSLQSFRDLFSSEALRPGESIGVERLAIMFTDLKGSTAMYRMVGDAPAFRRVMDHFQILKDSVARNRGALVKTIGDAIMAVFADPVNALEAAVDILESISQYNSANPDGPLVLKLGVHQGTCIAVTLNERLDYFGSVVNLAARLEGQSQGKDVVLSGAMITDPAVMQLIERQHLNVEPFDATLKGFADEAFSLYRLTLPTVESRPVPDTVNISKP
ncbi:MAG: DUF5939 domain-containing protein [Chloroflexota bacterium]